MPRLLVTPLSNLAEALDNHAPSHLVSLLSPEHMITTPQGYQIEAHLKLGMNDVADPAAGLAPPGPHHVEQLLAFSRDWDAHAPLVIHCWAGISRSMASAFIILCDRLGPDREIEIARAMRQRAPHAAPNRLLVAYADAALGREGRMTAAVNAMGPPLIVEQGVPTAFPLVGL
ncbi:MAG: tyrosine protein phosphatase [Alphaproteobacteria bacterium]|nr:tyrosine protein phosphatase [Alphaproteobacteria bacterium]